MTLELPPEAKREISKMVDEIQDRLDDLTSAHFKSLVKDPESPEIDEAFGLVYEEFMRVMRNE